MPLPLHRFSLPAAVAAVLFSGALASAQTLYWTATPGAAPSAARGGIWDNQANNWSRNPGGGSPTSWNSDSAQFNGPGGTITVGDTLFVNQIAFSGGGAYTFNTTSASLFFSGAGILNGAGQQFTGNGTLNFAGASTSGAANFTAWTGVLSYGTPGDVDAPSAGTSSIDNGSGGSVTFSAHSTGPNATITNAGTLIFEDASTAANTTISNTGHVGISGLIGTNLPGSKLINGNQGIFDLQAKMLTLSTGLTLTDGNSLDFKLENTTTHGLIKLTGGTFNGNPGTTLQGTTINIGIGAGPLAKGDYPLIDFSAPGVTLNSVNLGDFTLTLPAGLTGTSLKISNNMLVLALVPEPTSAALLLAGLPLICTRARRRQA